MGKQQFEDFLKQEHDKAQTPKFDPTQRIKEWLELINNLFGNVQDWLKDYTSKGQVQLEVKNSQHFEERLGGYEAPEMSIKINNKIATLIPIGTIMIGTRGRIDLVGHKGTIRFILADKNATKPRIEVKVYTSDEDRKRQEAEEKNKPKPTIELVWKIATNPPNIEYITLNQETFLQCLLEVVNG